jgi:uncharacterized membrane protein
MSESKHPTHIQDNVQLSAKQVEQQLVDLNPSIFKGIPSEKKQQILSTMMMVEQKFAITHHSGPLPSPEVIEKYNSAITNGADRIMLMAEKQQEHRIELEKSTIKEQLLQSRRGQTFGLIIGITSILASVTCILLGHDWPGAVIGAGGITGLVSVFVYGKRQQSKSLDDKSVKSG